MSSDFDDLFIISSTDKKVAKAIGKALKKKLTPEPVWGKDEGYCAWCVDGDASAPIWEEAEDSQGDYVKYACCADCAADRRVDGGAAS